MIGTLGAVSFGPASTESDLLALVRLLNDSAATEGRLATLAAARQAAEQAQAVLAEKQKELHVLAAALAQAQQLQADQSQNLTAQEAVIAARTVKLERDEAAFASESKAERAGLAEWDARLAVHAKAIADAEVRIDTLRKKAQEDATAAAALKDEYDGKLERLRSAVG
jgi:chromosome segregation ATPase